MKDSGAVEVPYCNDATTHSSGRTHHPYARCYNNNNNEATNNANSGHTASIPVQVAKRASYDEGKDEMPSSPVTVQARYRLQSPTFSSRKGEVMLSTSPVDAALRSPPYAWSPGSSLQGDSSQNQFQTGLAASTPIPVAQDVSVGGRGRSPYPASYAPASFAMPPALAGGMRSPHNDGVTRLPQTDSLVSPLRIGSPPLGCHGPEYSSPVLLPVSPLYHGDTLLLRSPKGGRGGGGAMVRGTSGDRPQSRTVKNSAGLGDGGSTVSGSSTSSIREDLALCPNDGLCTLINDRKHQRKFAHTCRLFPCYHGHVARHGKLFRHAEGQIAQTEGLSSGNGVRKRLPAEALASVNFSSISPEAPNAYRIIVSHGEKSYEIFGDWQNVRVHTFKRYLHQVYKIPPTSQVLVRAEGKVLLDDDIESVSRYGVQPDTVITLKRKEDDEPPRVPLEDL
ncbi:hypothetical protein DQ04_00301180 [Trypanosoma grayi]|uniref:hypothetical protein n=1 Tax=Trypanosoma grayi TaxID=71804 RepID=UPI0004F4AB5F|nr:hypothetical protein DQ04_00301180 [Trypanosoma grayi]KEG14808.1 hypothetical protein DQ04_00301180 [Trypanosoma grayi]